MNKKSILRTILILACVAAAVVFVCFRLYKKNSTKVIDIYSVSNMAVPDYEESSGYYASVSKGRVQNVILKDSLVSGVNVAVGDTVSEGDTLMVYDQTSLALAIASDRARIALLENQIDKANRQIAYYNGLIPSEYMPEDSEETVDHGPLKLVRTLKASDCKKNNAVIQCAADAVIRVDYLKALRDKKYTVTLELYDEDFCFGTYTIDGKKIPKTVDDYVLYVPQKSSDGPQGSYASGFSSLKKYVPLESSTDISETGLLTAAVQISETDPAEEPTDTPEPTEEPTVTPEPTEEPTVTPEPTEEPTVTPEPTEEPSVTPEPTEEPDVTPEPSEEPDVTPEPTEEPDVTPEPSEEPTVTPEPSGDPTVTPEPSEGPTVTPEPTAKPTATPVPLPDSELYIKVKADPLKEDWDLSKIVVFNGDGADFIADGSVKYYGSFSSCTPYEYERYETIYHFQDFDESSDNYMYSSAELAAMIKETQQEAEGLKIDLESARITLTQDLLISENGEVKAAISGTVTEVGDPADTEAGETIITVKGSENYVITVYVNEMDLAQLNTGDLLTGMAYESGMSFTASVTEKGDTPATDYYGWSESNPNTSNYPVSAVVNEPDVEMNIGEMCEVTPMTEDTEMSSSFFIPNSFIRSDERGSYIYKDDSGLLKKEYILTGRSMWGSYTEIKSGLTEEDYIAFPYGTGVTDGAATQVSENMYF